MHDRPTVMLVAPREHHLDARGSVGEQQRLMVPIAGSENIADILTKAQAAAVYRRLVALYLATYSV